MENLFRLFNIEIGKKEMICIVGAGGKTSVLFQLARELSAKGMRVVVTTTTAIYYPEREQYDDILISEEESPDLFDNRGNCGITVFGRSVSSEGKLLGVNPELLDTLFLKGSFDYIIVEGDGSKRKPIKAPAKHEPVIPSNTTRLIGVVGLDSIGLEAREEHVHRSELFCKITGCREQDIINTEIISRLIIHKEGLFKAAPVHSEKYLVLNKADREVNIRAAFDIAQKLSDIRYELDGIVISSFKNSSFRNIEKRISGIILAAGLSSRMGSNKLLLPVGGVPVIERVLAAASLSKLGEMILVCNNEMVASIGSKYGVKIVENTTPQLGQGRSVRLGVENTCHSSEGFMFLVGDQPFITAKVIDRLIEKYMSGNYSAVVPLYNGKRGNPVVFSYSLKEKLMGLKGDSGGRILLAELEESIATVDFEDEKAGFDIDTRQEYERLLKLEDENG